MPKRKDKKKKAKERAFHAERHDREAGPDADDDNASETHSEMSYSSAASPMDNAGDAVQSDEEETEHKLKESIENLSDKNSGIRTAALGILLSHLTGHYEYDLLLDWKLTLVDNLERCYKKGNQVEMNLVLRLFALFLLQLGKDAADVISRLLTIVKAMVIDNSQPVAIRRQGALALAISAFTAVEEPEEVESIVDALHNLWTQTKVNSADLLYCTILGVWSFLFIDMPNAYIQKSLCSDVVKLSSFLSNPSVDVRIATGEALALLYETASDMRNESYRSTIHDDLLLTLQQMSTESVKYRGKRDQRTQRACFRDICSAIREGYFPEVNVKFGEEVLVIDSWRTKSYYDNLCDVFAGGINAHLKENPFVRSVFFLGSPLQPGSVQKMSKFERKAMNSVMAKERQRTRGKERDKRSAGPSTYD